jgi:hypothetical protein
MSWLKRADTGLRDLTALIGTPVESGRLLLRRRQDKLIVVVDELVLVEPGSNVTMPRLENGWRPLYRIRELWFPSTSTQGGGSYGISEAGYFNLYGAQPGQAISARAECEAAGAFPSSMMGEPA